MPCYSSIQTVITDIESLEKAAKKLGIAIKKHNENEYTLSMSGEYIRIRRQAGAKQFGTVAMSGSGSWNTAIMDKLLPEYAKVQINKFAAKNGMTLSAGTKQGQYVLTRYR